MSFYYLSPPLAQKIVDKTMKIIDCNVNIFDKQGMIIASGDRRRIGEYHEGAALALKKSEAVAIDDALAKTLQGTRPGINLPLELDGEIVGIIGLTGEPHYLRQFGELVCMSAEMMMKQAFLLHELAQKNRLKEELVFNLIQSISLSSRLIEWAQRLDIDVMFPRIAFIIEIDHSEISLEAAIDELRTLQEYLLSLDPSNLIAMQSFKLIVLLPALNERGKWDFAEQKKRINRIIDYNKKVTQLNIKTALGAYFPGAVNNIAQSFQSAQATMIMGKKRLASENHYYYHDLILPVLLDGLKETWQADEFLQHLNILRKHDHNGILVRTLHAWFKNNLQMGATANTLFIHRNTLEYRLKKISAITNLNLNMLDDRLLIYVALNLEISSGN